MRRALLMCCACIWALFIGVTAFTAPAYAIGEYNIDELSTEVTVETDGSIRVVERQTLTFADENAGVVWYAHVPENGESVKFNSVRYAPVDNGGTQLNGWTTLQMIDSNPRQQGRNPGGIAAPSYRSFGDKQPWYSYNIGDGMIRCYFPTGATAAQLLKANKAPFTMASEQNLDSPADIERQKTFVIEADYVIAHRVQVFRDVAELYWRYANDSLPADAHNVTFQTRLPLPADYDPIAADQEVSAWGHGPNEGSFSVGEDGTVSFRSALIEQGNYAEAHIIFPSGWISNLDANASNRFSSTRRAAAIEEESAWVDVRLREAAWDNKVRVLFLCIALVIVLFGAVSVIRNGRSARSHQALMRASAAIGIVALGEHLFFKEPLTTIMLAILAIIVVFVSFLLPKKDPIEEAVDLDAAEEKADQRSS